MHKILLPICTLFVILAVAQESPRRPDNIGVAEFDAFKNNAFDILDESARLKTDASRIDHEVRNAGSLLTSYSADKIRQDIRALRGMGESSKALTQKISQLEEDGRSLLNNARNVNPRTKAPAATTNTNRSLQGLEVARKNLQQVGDLVENNLKLLTDELKKRGEELD
jgi:hypothetical protein